ncbi:MAG: FadR family transcriptional regulator [Alphaproteobacteria bacterium]|nr:FadR family transcriptional regulator [Alphaproteobacteria bacterium]
MTKSWPSAVTQTLPDQVVRMILRRIAEGDLRPGHRLPAQRELAQTMGVGLAVIREAVKRLEALDIVATVHGSGTTVRPFRWMPLIYDGAHLELAVQRIGIRDLWEARLMIESQIARLAVERATRADLDALEAVMARAAPLPADYASSQALNREFHLALARAAQNAVLADLVAPLLDVHVASAAPRFTPETCRKTWTAHRAILDAVAARDRKATERAITRHFAIGPIALDEIATRSRRGRR